MSEHTDSPEDAREDRVDALAAELHIPVSEADRMLANAEARDRDHELPEP